MRRLLALAVGGIVALTACQPGPNEVHVDEGRVLVARGSDVKVHMKMNYSVQIPGDTLADNEAQCVGIGGRFAFDGVTAWCLNVP